MTNFEYLKANINQMTERDLACWYVSLFTQPKYEDILEEVCNNYCPHEINYNGKIRKLCNVMGPSFCHAKEREDFVEIWLKHEHEHRLAANDSLN